MKIFVTILAVVGFASAAQWTVKNSEQMKAIRDECAKEHHLSREQLEKMSSFEFPNEEPVRKYFLCTSKKIGIFCPCQGFYADRVVQQFKMDMEEEKFKKLTDDCIAKYPKSDAKANDVVVFQVHGCLMEGTIGKKLEEYNKKSSDAAEQNHEK